MALPELSVGATIKVSLLGLLAYVGWQALLLFVINPIRSPLRHLPGPPLKGWFRPQVAEFVSPLSSPATHDTYMRKYGKSYRFKGLGYFEDRLFTLDPRVISHVMSNHENYEKPWQFRRMVTALIGNGLVSSEGMRHKMQRKAMDPAFSMANIRALSPIFVTKAYELRNRWIDLVKGGTTELDIARWISRATFDVIGLAGFDYALNAIQNEDNEMYLAYRDMFHLVAHQRAQSPRAILSIYFPWTDHILPDEAARIMQRSHEVIYKVGSKLVQTKKQEFLDGKAGGTENKDLLSLLIKSNMSNLSIEQRITDRDIMDQINTFFFAGSDTSSLALSWTFYLLAQHPEFQTRLRDDIINLMEERLQDPNDVDFSAVDSLPFLDKVTKEALRLIPPVHSTVRVAMKDDVIPTSFPVKMANGDIKNEILIRKGQFVHVAVEGFNLDKSVWGDDAWEFNPNRWDNLPEAVRNQPGMWGNLMTFLAGQRGCLGFRFAILEIKVFLFALLPAFKFKNVTDKEIFKYNFGLTRPYVRGEFDKGSQLPMMVTPYKAGQERL